MPIRQGVLALLLVIIPTVSAGAEAGAGKNKQSASIQSVIQGFVDAVYLYCLPYVDAEIDFSEALHPGAPSQILPASAGRARNPQSENWVVGGVGEIILLEGAQDHTQCRVSAYGPPVELTFNIVAGRLEAPDLGFAEPAQIERPEREFMRRLERERDGHVDTVTLTGNEPGAAGTRSRFSTLTAVIRRDPSEDAN